MSVMASNTMTSSGIPGRVSTVVNHIDDMQYNRVQSYVNINTNEEINGFELQNNKQNSNAISKTHNLSTKSIENCAKTGCVNNAFEDNEDGEKEKLNEESENLYMNTNEHVYANLSEISKHEELENIDRRPVPPIPTTNTLPIRVFPTGWKEYKTLGGRTYYFHPEKFLCQWKPPRNQKSMNSSVTLQTYQNNCEPSTSLNEINNLTSIKNEYDVACCSADNSNTAVPDGMIFYHSALIKATANEFDKKNMMCSSVNVKLENNYQPCIKKLDSYFSNQNKINDGFNNANNVNSIQKKTENLTNYNFNQRDQNLINTISQKHLSATPIRQGALEKCRILDNGVKVKKKEWMNSYAYLYSSHFLFYKDQKSAEKTGKHYPAPTDVCDLRGALLFYEDTEKEKDKRHKHIISLILFNKTKYLFSCANESEINGWFYALRQAISLLPSAVQTQALPTILDYGGSLQRSSLRNKTLLSQSSKGSFSFGNKSSLHHSVKTKLKNSNLKDNTDNCDLKTTDGAMSRDSIIDRLLRFFRSRPTIELLRERGIYKPEPVFGSTLAAICQHERSLVPKFLSEVTRLIEEKGLDIDGLYRVNGNLSSVQKIRCQIDQDKYEALQNEHDVHVLTGALKLFFRELSEPIFPMNMNRDFMSAIREPNLRQRFKAIDELLSKLPSVNRETLKVLLTHLERVSKHSSKNRMQIHNLAIMFGPTLFGTEDRMALKKSSTDSKNRNFKRKSIEKKDENLIQVEPNQNLAYKMVIYGQIVEFILNESKKFSIFQNSLSC